MALGVKRETLGDILLEGSTGYVLCLDQMADYIRDSLTQVRHTTVTCSVCELPPASAFPVPQRRGLNVASLRCDAVTAAVYDLSRGESQELFRQKKIFINSRLCQEPSRELREGDRVSVRGRGRYVFVRAAGETRKGRLRIDADVYV
jgi:RNA-binding protein YlmH